MIAGKRFVQGIADITGESLWDLNGPWGTVSWCPSLQLPTFLSGVCGKRPMPLWCTFCSSGGLGSMVGSRPRRPRELLLLCHCCPISKLRASQNMPWEGVSSASGSLGDLQSHQEGLVLLTFWRSPLLVNLIWRWPGLALPWTFSPFLVRGKFSGLGLMTVNKQDTWRLKKHYSRPSPCPRVARFWFSVQKTRKCFSAVRL